MSETAESLGFSKKKKIWCLLAPSGVFLKYHVYRVVYTCVHSLYINTKKCISIIPCLRVR